MPVGPAGDRSAIEDDWGRTTPVEQGGLVAARPWQACGARRRGPAGASGPPVCPRLAPRDERNVASLVGRHAHADSG